MHFDMQHFDHAGVGNVAQSQESGKNVIILWLCLKCSGSQIKVDFFGKIKTLLFFKVTTGNVQMA